MGINQTVASQPIPKMAVAAKRVAEPRISGTRKGILGKVARPPKRVSRRKERERPMLP